MNSLLNNPELLQIRDSLELEMEIEDIAKELFQTRSLPPSQTDASVKFVMNWAELHSFLRHIAMFLTLHDGKFGPAGRDDRLALKEKLVDKFHDRLHGNPNAKPEWECVGPKPI